MLICLLFCSALYILELLLCRYFGNYGMTHISIVFGEEARAVSVTFQRSQPGASGRSMLVLEYKTLTVLSKWGLDLDSGRIRPG